MNSGISNAEIAEALKGAPTVASAARVLGITSHAIFYRSHQDSDVAAALQQQRERRQLPECRNRCGQRIKRRRSIFCSHRCRWEHEERNRQAETKPKAEPKRPYPLCLNGCGQRVSDRHHKYCSHPCRWEHLRKSKRKGADHGEN